MIGGVSQDVSSLVTVIFILTIGFTCGPPDIICHLSSSAKNLGIPLNQLLRMIFAEQLIHDSDNPPNPKRQQ